MSLSNKFKIVGLILVLVLIVYNVTLIVKIENAKTEKQEQLMNICIESGLLADRLDKEDWQKKYDAGELNSKPLPFKTREKVAGACERTTNIEHLIKINKSWIAEYQ